MPDRRTERLGDLAQFVLSVGRDIRLGLRYSADIIEVSELESLVISHLQLNPGISPSRLGAEIGLRSSNVSEILRALAGRGMIERVPDPTDRRFVSVQLTPLAVENLARVRAEWAAFLAAHVDETTELDAAIGVLEAIDTSVTRSGSLTAASSSA
jgi:DNA-binding MarR family transcriptional regulator